MALNFELVVSDRPAFHSSFSLLQVIQNKHPWCLAAAYVTAGLERFGNKRMTTEQCALPELSIEIRVGVRIGDRGQPDTLVLLAVV